MLTKIPKIIFAVGLILSFISFQLITDQQKAQRAKEFKNHAQKAASLIKSKLDVNKEILLNIASLYSASDSVTRDEFKKFVTPIFERNDFIQALEWAPRVLHKNRDAFESRVQKEGYPNFHISDRIEQTTKVPAGVRSEYFPVMFAEPYEENKQVLGFDVASASTRLSTLSESRDSGQFLASPVIKLVHARGKEIGVLIFAPFYSGSEVSDTIEERRKNLIGFVLGVYRIETMLNSLVAPVTEPGMKLVVFEGMETVGNKAIFGELQEHPLLEERNEIDFYGRKWTFVMQGDDGFGTPLNPYFPLAVSGALFSFFLFIAIIISLSYSRTRKIEKEVELRTQDLSRVMNQNALILDSAGEGIYGLDNEGNTTFVNPAATEMLGYQIEELIGKPQHPLIHHSRADGTPYPREDCHIYATIKNGNIHRETNEVFWRKDGSSFPVEYTSTPIQENGKYVGAVVTFRDITVEKWAEHRNILRYNLTRILAEAETMDDGVSKILQAFTDQPDWDLAFYWAVKPESDVLHCRFGANSRRLSSEAYKEFSKQTFSMKFEKGIGLPGRIWESGKPAWIDEVVNDPNFPRHSVAAKVGIHGGLGFPIFSDKKFWGVVEVFTTARSNLDEGLRDLLDSMGSQIGQFMQRMESELDLSRTMIFAQEAKQEAEAANRAKSVFLANMSHEIRTPMNAILGYAQILNMDESLNARQQESVRTIETSGNHLLELINSILDISKIEAGRVELNVSDFNLNGLLEGLETMFRGRCESKGLSFCLDGLGQEPVHVRGDEGKLRQILVNLLGNALKFTDQGGVDLELKRREGDKYIFRVKDSGKGVSFEDSIKIFEPFKQTNEGFDKGGTGLGLAISKELAELMGGYLSVESKVGVGSCFSVSLELPPAKKAVSPRSKRNRKAIRLPEGYSVKALIVDDIQVNRQLLSQVLNDVGVETMEAENGKVALECLDAFEPHIIFMDIRMPVMGGEETISRIIKQYGPDRFKIVAITASVFEHQREKFKTMGCNDFIAKPFRIFHIHDCIQNLLDLKFEYKSKNKEDRNDDEKGNS